MVAEIFALRLFHYTSVVAFDVLHFISYGGDYLKIIYWLTLILPDFLSCVTYGTGHFDPHIVSVYYASGCC